MCCNPLGTHKKPIVSQLKLVTPLFGLPRDLDGQWLCNNCIKSLKVSADKTDRSRFAPYGHKKKTLRFVVCISKEDGLPQRLNKWVCTNCLKRLKIDASVKPLLNEASGDGGFIQGDGV
ncbi:uncharacterized protein LOC117652510 [Thrips palmi]|uniref:Uncharacterized protein LOC117652510 n=1 Tax=Thrips palmi TaxID=161013 RepID=A0A6P9A654_THRPL|nr:uncharacterized protein LOC117652510 [Thrips palmi]